MAAGQPVYSFSRVTTFEQCARRYRYRYVDQVKEAFRGIEAFMGQRVHATIEWMFSGRQRGSDPDSEQVVRHYCDGWDRELAASRSEVRIVKAGMDTEAYRRRGAELVAAFHHERFAADQLETLALEKHFKVTLGGLHRFQGFIDRLARDNRGLVHVIDYKTGKRAPASFTGKEADQLRAYALAIFLESDLAELELRLEFLQAGKILTRRVARREAAEIENGLVRRIHLVEDSTVFPPKPSPLCGWCGYNDVCEAYPGPRPAGRV